MWSPMPSCSSVIAPRATPAVTPGNLASCTSGRAPTSATLQGMSTPTTIEKRTPPPPAPPRSDDLLRLARRPVRSLRHPVQWILTALVLVVVLNFGQTLFTNPAWEWAKVPEYVVSPAVLTGLQGDADRRR